MPETTDSTFEASLAELEQRVRRLESSDVPLDEALALFEEGMTLSKACHDKLAAAASRVARLTRGTAGIESAPLPEPTED